MSKGKYKIAKHVGIFNLPAVYSCPNCKDCLETCYARQAQMQYPTAMHSRNENLHLAKNSPEVLKQLILDQIDNEKIRVIRIHESGDFFDEAYVLMWLKIAIQRPHVYFYSYSKVMDIEKFPKIAAAIEAMNELTNVNIINSYIDGYRNYGTPEYVQVLHRRFGAFICPGEDCMTACTKCLTADKVAFIIHGSRKGKDNYAKQESQNK